MLGLEGVYTKVFGTRSERMLKKKRPLVARINELESGVQALDDEALRARTADFRQRIEAGAPLDDLLPEAYAVVRETAVRTLGMRHFDVQLLGGVVLHEGMIAEMKTGEARRSPRRSRCT